MNAVNQLGGTGNQIGPDRLSAASAGAAQRVRQAQLFECGADCRRRLGGGEQVSPLDHAVAREGRLDPDSGASGTGWGGAGLDKAS
jgi:hypothetical protein